MSDTEKLTPPFVVWEPDDPELLFFEVLEDILEDREDCLWQEDYTGVDASGKKFYLKRVKLPQRLVEKVLNTAREYLEIIKIDEESAVEETRVKIIEWLQGQRELWPDVADSMPEITPEWLNRASLARLLTTGILWEKKLIETQE